MWCSGHYLCSDAVYSSLWQWTWSGCSEWGPVPMWSGLSLVCPGQAVSCTELKSSPLPVPLLFLQAQLWGRHSPHSPSHGKVPSSPARDGTVLPISLTHQQWPRCMPLEDRHYKTTGDCSGFGTSKVVIRNAKSLIMVSFRYQNFFPLFIEVNFHKEVLLLQNQKN